MKKTHWRQTTVGQHELAKFLTRYNFQAGQFLIVQAEYPYVVVVYVDKETEE